MSHITPDTMVRDIVVAWPQTRWVLEHHGVDYCCNGQMPLKAATDRAGANYDRVVADLQQTLASPVGAEVPRDWTRAGLAELADHILDTHHAFMHRQLPRIRAMVKKVMAAHPNHMGMLASLQRVFEALREEIEVHLMKEEQVLFPYIKELDRMVAGQTPFSPMHCGSVANPIGQMEHEHDSAGAALAEMRRLTSNYVLPPDACPTFAELYQSLQELEADLHEHIHLENNILFPGAVAAEKTVGRDS